MKPQFEYIALMRNGTFPLVAAANGELRNTCRQQMEYNAEQTGQQKIVRFGRIIVPAECIDQKRRCYEPQKKSAERLRNFI